MIAVFFSQPWLQRLGWTLLHFLWQGTAVALLYAVIRALLRRCLSAQGRYALACLALAAMTAAPPLTFLLIPAAEGGVAPIQWSASAFALQRILPGVAAVWLAGVAAFSIRLFGAWRFTARMRIAAHPAPPEWQRALGEIAFRVGASRPVRLLVSSLVEVPIVLGWLRPVILVPLDSLTGVPMEHIAALLAHELAHIRRHDYLASILQNIAEALLFYHPAVWWISQQVRAERELCCDDLAVAASGDALTYARALAALESRRARNPQPALAANGGSLLQRIRRLAGESQPLTHSLPGLGTAWALTMFLLAGIGAVALHAGEAPKAQPAHAAIRRFTPRGLAAAPPAAFPAPPPIKGSSASPMLAALLFDPFFAAPQAPALPASNPADPDSQFASFSGTVMTTSGKPVAQAQVTLIPTAPPAPTATGSPQQFRLSTAFSGADGKFVIDKIPPGAYRLLVSHPLYVAAATEPGSTNGTAVTLTAGQRVEDYSLKLMEPGTISGRVVDEDGDPVAQATIEVTRFVYSDGKRRLSQTAGASSDDNGDFKVTRIPPGTYIVKTKTLPSFENVRAPIPAAKPGHLYNPNETYYGDTRIAGEALPVKVGAGQTVALGVIRMRNRALPTVRGKVTGDLSLLADAHVGFLLPDAGGGGIPSRYIADIQKDGSYAVANLWESAAGDAVTIGVDSRKLGLLAFTTIAVRAEGEEGVVLNVAAAPLSGSVRMEDDPAAPQPLPPMQVRLRALGQVAVIAPTAAVKPDGSFAIPLLAAGTYSAEVSGLPPGSYVKSVKLNGKESREQGMDWAGPGSGPLEVLISRKAAVLGGAVKDEDGNPVSGTVTLVPVPPRPGHPSLYPTATADEHGVFRFAALTPGTYQVYAWEEIEPTAHWDPRFMDRFATRAETVEVGESGHATVSLKRITAAAERGVLRSLPI